MSTDRMEAGLLDSDPEARRKAVLAIAQATDRKLAPLLLKALGDNDWRVRKEAVQIAIARAAQFGMIEPLVAAICQGENVGLRNAALDVLETLGEVAAPALIAALPAAPDHARKFVVEALGESGGAEVVEELAKAALSEDVNVAGEAIEALAHIKGPAAERVIRGRLRAPDAFLRLAALDALNRREAVIPWAELEPLLEERMLRRVVLCALGRTAERAALAPLFAALEESTLHVVSAAAVALVRLLAQEGEITEAAEQRLLELSERARAWLRGVLSANGDPDAVRASAELLVHARDAEALGLVVAQLAREAPTGQIVGALRKWGAAAVEPLLALWPRLERSEERAIALELAADLALIDTQPAVVGLQDRVRGALRRALTDADPALALAALRCFAQWAGAEDATPLLAHALSPDVNLARAAALALEALVPRAPEAVERALSGTNLAQGQAAVLAPVVAALGGSRALELLQLLLTADSGEVRKSALVGLGRVGGERAASLVAFALVDEDTEVQIVAAQVLGRMRDEHGEAPGVSALVNAVASEFPHVRSAVARALGQTGSERALEALSLMLRDADGGVAMAAVEAFGQLSPRGRSPSLHDALAHPDREVVKAALRALNADPGAAQSWISALSHTAWDVRKLAVELLAQLPARQVQGPLRAALGSESDDLVREALQQALEKLEGRA